MNKLASSGAIPLYIPNDVIFMKLPYLERKLLRIVNNHQSTVRLNIIYTTAMTIGKPTCYCKVLCDVVILSMWEKIAAISYRNTGLKLSNPYLSSFRIHYLEKKILFLRIIWKFLTSQSDLDLKVLEIL